LTKNAPNNAPVAVLGALAYDRIATSRTAFGPDGPNLNCKVSATTEHLGGCGGNLVYHLDGMQKSTLLLSISGHDDARYQAALRASAVDLSGLYRDTGASCATAYIITDPQGQQFTAFHSGPEILPTAWTQHLESIKSRLIDYALLLCAPFPAELTLSTMAFMHRHNPTALIVWCPGQFTDQMNAGMLNACSAYADWLMVNEYEANHIRLHAPEIFLSKTVIITNGAAAVEVLLSSGERKHYPVQEVTSVVDPTGSGDAFTAGVVSQLLTDTKQPLTHLDAAIEAGLALARQCLSHRGAQPANLEP
jgi:sugar/nucleoside kinase (ribokinase family)